MTDSNNDTIDAKEQETEEEAAESTAIDTRLMRRLNPEVFGDKPQPETETRTLLLPSSTQTKDVEKITAPHRLGRQPNATTLTELEKNIPIEDDWGAPVAEKSQSVTQTQFEEESDSQEIAQDQHTSASEVALQSLAEQGHFPRLICTQGEDKGKEFVLKNKSQLLGRSPTAEIFINDPSISRLHCRIYIKEDRYFLSDEKSANGTTLNGHKIHQEQVLTSGSVIKIGQTILRFVEMGDVIQIEEPKSNTQTYVPVGLPLNSAPVLNREDLNKNLKKEIHKKKTIQKYAIIIISFSLLSASVIVSYQLLKKRNNNNQGLSQALLNQAEEVFEQGKAALLAKNFNLAREKFRFSASLIPSDVRYQEFLNRVEQEQNTLAKIEEARTEVGKKNYKNAHQILLSIDQKTLFSAELQFINEEYHAAVSNEIRQVKELLRKNTLNKEHALLLDKSVQELKNIIDNKDPEIQQILIQFETRKKKILEKKDPVQPVVLDNALAHKNKPEDNHIQPALPAQSTSHISLLGKQAMTTYQQGKIEEAMSILANSNAEQETALRNKMAAFQKLYEQAKLDVNAQKSDTIQTIKKAAAFEYKISGGASYYASQLRIMESEYIYQQGLNSHQAQRYQEAYSFFKQALAKWPEHAQAKKKLTELTGKARDIYNQGLVIKNIDPAQAKEKFKLVMSIAPVDDEIHQKAKKMLEQLK